MSEEWAERDARARARAAVGWAVHSPSSGAAPTHSRHLHGRTHTDLCAFALRAAFDPTRMASDLGLTLRDLERLFHSLYDRSPRTILRRWRAQFAAALLDQGTPAKQVAAELGYCHSSHLHRELQVFEHATPRDLQHHDRGHRLAPEPAGTWDI